MKSARASLPAGDAVAAQADTVSATLGQILGSAAFAAGVADVRGGKPIRFDAFGDDDWNYERGRLWAHIAPLSMPLRIGRRLNPRAVAILGRAMSRGEVL